MSGLRVCAFISLSGSSRLSSAKISACHEMRAVIPLQLLLLLVSVSTPLAVAQEASSVPQSPAPTIHIESNLVLVDVIALKLPRFSTM
jgi:hypothetical protein